jgi:hypothetical protein
MRDPKVLKESGEMEDYDRRKVLSSLLRVGVRPEDAGDIIRDIARTVKPPLTTRKIFKAAKKFLRRYDAACTMKYSLKEAIYALGPSGYPFERYVARVLRERGYEVQVGQFVEGRCVVHEVDLLARKEGLCLMIECKFHHNRKTTSDVKTALYVHARFLDILKAGRMCPGDADRRGMLVTNTRFTSEALKYAECAGLKTMGWRHPEGESLERLIEQGRTYPVTILPGAKKAVFQALLGRDLVLARDVLDTSAEKLVRLTGLRHDQVSQLKSLSAKLCGPS